MISVFAVFPAMLVALALPARDDCPLPDPASDERQLEAALADARAACQPLLAEQIGRLRLARGAAAEALGPLCRASLTRPSALPALADAQALAGEPFEALRTLSRAQMALAANDASREHMRETATLLARHHLRRGGSAFGAYRFDADFAPNIDDGIGILAHGNTVMALTRRGAYPLGAPAARYTPGAAKVRSWALGPAGHLGAIDGDGVLHRQGRPPLGLVSTAGDRIRGTLLLGRDDGALVLDKSRLWFCDALGSCSRAVALDGDGVGLSRDGRGEIHVLLEDKLGVRVLTESGATLRTIPADADGWAWRQPQAIASDRFGGTYVLDASAGLVFLYDPAGRYAGRMDPPTDDAGLLRDARALAVDDAGNLYVLTNARKVVRYR